MYVPINNIKINQFVNMGENIKFFLRLMKLLENLGISLGSKSFLCIHF